MCVCVCVCVWCVVSKCGKNAVRMCRQKDMKKAAKRHQKRVGVCDENVAAKRQQQLMTVA